MEDKRDRINNSGVSKDRDIETLLRPKREFHVSAGFKDKLMKEIAGIDAPLSQQPDIVKDTEPVKGNWRFVPWVASIAAVAAVVVIVAVSVFKDNDFGSQNQGMFSEAKMKESNTPGNGSSRNDDGHLISKENPVETVVLTESGETEGSLKNVTENSKSFIAGAIVGEKSENSRIENIRYVGNSVDVPASVSKESGIKEMELKDLSDDNPALQEVRILSKYNERIMAGMDEYPGGMPLAPAGYSKSSGMYSEVMAGGGEGSQQLLAAALAYDSNSYPMSVSDDFSLIPMSTDNEHYPIYSASSFGESENAYSGIVDENSYLEKEIPAEEGESYFTDDEKKRLRTLEQQEYVARMRLEVEMAEAFAKQIQSAIERDFK